MAMLWAAVSVAMLWAAVSVAQLAEHHTRFTRPRVRFPAGRSKVIFFATSLSKVLKVYSDT